MKKTLKLVVFLLLATQIQSIAQSPEIEAAKFYLMNEDDDKKPSKRDLSEMSVIDAYLSPSTGWTHVYFNQTYKNILVYNAIANVTLNNGHALKIGNEFIPNLESLISDNSSFTPKITEKEAIIYAAKATNAKAIDQTNINNIGKLSGYNGISLGEKYDVSQLSAEPVSVRPFWFFHKDTLGIKETQTVELVWNVSYMNLEKQNSWNVQVNANSGEILAINDDVIHCNFGEARINEQNHSHLKATETKDIQSPDSYTVFDIGVESPNHGARTIVTSPYTNFTAAGTGPGNTNGWHEDGTNTYTDTRGNNVHAQDDIDADNSGGTRPNPSNRDFAYPYTLGLSTAAANRDASITNLFYWNNLIHDVLWNYGFDETAGNFQANNMSRGGNQNDYVFADAQDGSSTNNANFYTPSDGSNPRMQMFLWNTPSTYEADSDFDNGIISHEYGHGWSNRLTGGPSTTSCLNNSEQGGEGWSDYLGLMLTTDWSSLQPNYTSAAIPRGIGTYVLGETTSGPGIRPYPYSYNMSENSAVTYAAVGDYNFSQPHGIGSIWCTILWDMTWEIIFEDNAIESDIHNTSNMVGNVAALKLVNEGLRLQSCSPSFVDARDAILAADNALFNGKYHCAISNAFSKRGVGKYASTGTSSDDRTVVEDFTPLEGTYLVSEKELTLCSGQNLTYTASVNDSQSTILGWTRAAVAGISNPAASGTAANINETLSNTTTETVQVVYQFTFSSNSTCGSGGNVSELVIVNVQPIPNFTTIDYSICQGVTVPIGDGMIIPGGPTVINFVEEELNSSDDLFNRYGDTTNSYYYDDYTFTPNTSGSLVLEIVQGSYDTYLYLYEGSFDPQNPSINRINYNDDGGSGLLSKMTTTVSANTTYIVVVTSFYSYSTGTYELEASQNVFDGTYEWYSTPSTDNILFSGNIFNPVGVTESGINNTISPGNNVFYAENPAFPLCRVPANFTIQPATENSSTLGIVSESDTVCTLYNNGTLNLSGHTGVVSAWEISEDGFDTWSTIGSNSLNWPYAELLNTTSYRALFNSGNCLVFRSEPAHIHVINPLKTITDTTLSKTALSKASLYIDSDEKVINSDVHYEAGRGIELNPGFETQPTTVFKANIFENQCDIPVILSIQADSSNIKDADISDLLPDSTSTFNPYLAPFSWTSFGNTEHRRSLLEFDLSSIPANAVIDSAYLSLYYSQEFVDNNPPFTGHFGDNAIEIRRVSAAWNDSTVTWNTQPATTGLNATVIPAAPYNSANNIDIDVTNLVSDIKAAENYGFMLKHLTEVPYKISTLCASEEVNPLKRPKLVVHYHYY